MSDSIPGAEGGNSGERADFRFEDNEGTTGDLETRPTKKFKRVEQRFLEGENPVAYFRGLAQEAQGRMQDLQRMEDPRGWGINPDENFTQQAERVKEAVEKKEGEMRTALKEARRFNRWANIIEKGVNDPSGLDQADFDALDQAHNFLLEESVRRQEMVVEEKAAKVRELYEQTQAADQDPRNEKPIPPIRGYQEGGNIRNTMFDLKPSSKGQEWVLLSSQLKDAQQELEAANHRKEWLERMAGHVRSVLEQARNQQPS